LLYDDSTAQFKLHAFAPRPCPQGKKAYSLTLTQHCFRKGESFLCSDSLKSQWGGGENERDRASVICALLRSPRKRLGVLHLGRRADQTPFNNEDLQLADALAASISAGVESAQIIERYRDPFLSKTATFVRRVLELRDPAAGQHLQRVHTYAGVIAEELGLHPEDRKVLQVGALLHEMGHVVMPEPGAAPRELALKAAALAEALPDLEAVVPMIRSQHEHWDGTGVPDGLAGEKIPLSARIVAVADAFDTLMTESGRTLDDALNELKSAAGSRFDPKLVEHLVRLRPRLEEQLRGSAEAPEASLAR
jgi:response regulator RpfG family c-di-GMP phosphodiesterase